MKYWRETIDSRSRIFFVCLLLFIAGIAAGNFLFGNHFYVFCALLFLFLVLIIAISRDVARNVSTKIILLFIICSLFGFWRYQISLPDFSDASKIYHYNGQSIKFSGRIINIDERIDQQKIIAESSAIGQKKTKPVSGSVLINTGLFPKYDIGDLIAVSCQLKKPEPVNGFDYGRFLSESDIYSICSFADIRAERGQYSWQNLIYKLRLNLSQSINASVSEPAASLLNGMMLGLARGIPADLNDLFSKLGLTHIIAISGSHITTIAAILMLIAIAIGIKRPLAFWPVSAVIIFYTVLVGAPASAVRAAIMAIVMLYAQKIGRRNSMKNALALSAALMLLVNPKILLIDVGFQLSFMSVIGLVYLVPILEKYFFRLPQLWQIKEILLVTLAAQIMTLPLTIFYFERFTPVTLLANILILPIIPFLTIWGLANMIAAAIWLPLGRLMGYVSWLLVAYWVEASRLLGKLPLTLEIKSCGWLILLITYPLIGYWLWREKKKNVV